ncbi:MAG: myo-inosose-2 dehydratase [Candidatus Rokubacteria bacterium]|nr:myo-inosose-2 dehydratase [Candidatus Rokubacteria bacterium]
MAVRLGVNPIGWTNDDLPELGDETSLEVCLAEAREAGYGGIELGRKFPRRAAELRPILARHGLVLVSGWYGAELRTRSVKEEFRAVEDHLALLVEMDCRVMVFAEVSGAVHGRRDVPLSRRPRLAEGEWGRFGEALTEVAEHLQRRGLRMAYHHHMGTVVETEAEIDRLMAVTGEGVGLLLDTGHLTYAGGDVLGLARRHGRRLVHVHCKDARPAVLAEARRLDRSFLDAVVAGVFTVPGDGCVVYGSLTRALKEVGYSGWLVVEAEQDPAVAHPLTYAKLGFANLSRAVAAAGL